MKRDAVKNAIQQFVAEHSGIMGARVIWELQGAPAPHGDYISLSFDFLPTIGEDHRSTPAAGSVSDLTFTECERSLMLHIRIFTDDFQMVGSKIQAAFLSKEKSFDFRQRQIVHIIFDTAGALLTWSWTIEGVPFLLTYVATPLLDTLLTDAADAMTASADLPTGITAEADLIGDKVGVQSVPGREFQFGTEDVRVELTEFQQAIDFAFRGDHGVQTVPDEVRTDYAGTGALDVILATTFRDEEDMEFIEKIEVTDEVTGATITVDVDDPPE